MSKRLLVGLLLASVAAATSAQASVTLIARGALTGSAAGSYTDLSGLTDTLENGVSDAILGGLGSGLTYAGGNTFLAVPDRGPNAVPFNSAIDDTASYINRVQTVSMTLTPTAPGSALPFALTPTLTKTTLLYSATALNYGSGAGLGDKIDGVTPIGSGAPAINDASHYYFTGRSDNYGAGTSENQSDARFDPESVRVSPDGKDVFISDEYGPYVREFDRSTGQLVRSFSLPNSGASNAYVSTLSPQGAVEIAGNTSGRVANKGAEGMALTPDGKTLVVIVQAALEQDAGNKDAKKLLRIYTIDVATGKTTGVYGYKLSTGSGVSDLVAVNDHEFLVDERDGDGLGNGDAAVNKQLYLIDLNGAKDITNLTGKAAADDAVGKTMFLDVVAGLNAAGIPSTQIPAKIEGVTFGEDVTVGGQTEHTLWIANDNDFVQNVSGPNQFFVFGFSDSDLPQLTMESIAAPAPEPATWAFMAIGVGGLGGALRLNRRKAGTAILAR